MVWLSQLQIIILSNEISELCLHVIRSPQSEQ